MHDYDDYMLDKVLDKIKKIIRIEKFGDTKIVIETDDKLPDDITFKSVVILITCIIKDGDKFYPQYFWKKHSLLNKYFSDFSA